MHKSTRFLLCVCPLLAALVSGCGYRLIQGTNPAIPSSMRSIYIEPVKNKSNELLLGTWITDELRHEFLRSGPLKLASREEADVILEGEIVNLTTSGLSYIRYDQTIERRIYAECAVRLVDARTGDVLWQTANISRDEDFFVGRELLETEGLKEESLKRLSRVVAEVIHHRISGLF